MISTRRRKLLAHAAALAAACGGSFTRLARAAAAGAATAYRRVRPSDPEWPPPATWERLDHSTGGRLVKVQAPLDACDGAADSAGCVALFKELKNPYYIGDNVALTQTSGWVDAWTSAPSVYAVAARSSADVVAAVNFAREHRLRLVVKGGGHSYQGTSNAPDSLLVWTRAMDAITLHDAFVGHRCEGRHAPQPAVSIGAGAIWMHVYNAVMTQAGRYVQGGGCATVGVAGLIQSGGFGSFSKNYGMAAAGLLEAEVVTADGAVRIANACTHPDLFWALKGGGGGSLGVVTRLTLRTRELPEFFGGVSLTIKAASDHAYRRLVGHFARFYRDSLFNPHWGEQASFNRDNTLTIAMVFQGLTQAQAVALWKPLLDWVAASPREFSLAAPPFIVALPARRFWDPTLLRTFPNVVIADDRPGAPERNVFWAGNLGEAGQFLHGYQSLWLPASLLREGRLEKLCDALYASSRQWRVSLHFNKGLAGAPRAEVIAAGDTATNPAVMDAFALAISGSEGPPAFAGIAGHEPDLARARSEAAAIERAMKALQPLGSGAYVSEGNYFDGDWQRSYWGRNYPRLSAIKRKYDPDGLFFVHHGVGSEAWSADGFTRIRSP